MLFGALGSIHVGQWEPQNHKWLPVGQRGMQQKNGAVDKVRLDWNLTKEGRAEYGGYIRWFIHC